MKRDSDPATAGAPLAAPRPSLVQASAGAAAPVADAASAASPARSRSGIVLALQARALAQTRARAATTLVVNDLAVLLGCRRVSLGFTARNGHVAVDAISGATDVRAEQNAVRALTAAMDEAIGQQRTVVYPLPPGATPVVSLAHAELAAQSGSGAMVTVPIVVGDAAVGALLLERARGIDAQAQAIATDVASFVGPLLHLKHQLDQPVTGRFVRAAAATDRPTRWRRQGALLAAAVAVLAAAAMWPTTFNVRAPARAEGALQQVLAAPFDGFVGTVHLRPGEPVRAGQVLLTLQEADLALQRDTRAADLAQHEKAYREAMTGEDAAAIVGARARLAQAQAEFELVQRQLDRAQIRAPFDGVLLAGDFTQALGAPVKRGQELMTVAPDRGWRVVVEVDEQDVAAVKPGQQARVMFAAAAEPVQMTVTRVAPVATPSDGRNAFEVEGEVTAGAAALRPGLRGFARIEVGERALGAIWLHRIGNGVRRLLWRVLG